MSSTIRNTSGWFFATDCAMLCSSIVLPVRGGATIRPRWPLPIGAIRSITRPDSVVGRRLEDEALLRIERREVLEEQLVARLLGRFEVDRFDLDQREVALPFLGRPDLPRDGVAGLQVELADLRRGDVDVVGARQVVVVGRAEEPEAVGQHFEHAFGEDEAALLGLRLEDLEDQLLLAHPGRAGDVQVLGDLRELLDALVLQIGDVQPTGAPGILAGIGTRRCAAVGTAGAPFAAARCGRGFGPARRRARRRPLRRQRPSHRWSVRGVRCRRQADARSTFVRWHETASGC